MAVLKPFAREISEAQDDLLEELENLWKPWVLAKLVFAPWYESATPVIEKISAARAWTGFVITVWMCWPFLGFGFFQDFLNDLGNTIFIAGIATVAVLVGGFFLHEIGDRRHYLKGAVFPFGRVVAGVVIIELVQLLFHLRFNLVVALMSLVIGIWLLGFFAGAFWHVGTALFGTSDAHPVLSPVTTALTLTAALVYKLGFARSGLPVGVSMTIDFVGYLTALVLCGYELIRVLAIQRMMAAGHSDIEDAREALAGGLREWWHQPDLRTLVPSVWAAVRGPVPTTERSAGRTPESMGGEPVEGTAD